MNSSSNVRTFIVGVDEAGIRLDVFLAKHAGLSRSRIKHLIVEGYSLIKNGKVPKSSYPVETGDIIEITTPSSKDPDCCIARTVSASAPAVIASIATCPRAISACF